MASLANRPRGAGISSVTATQGGRLLSQRELEVLHCLLSGCSNKQISKRLTISEGTVKVHVKAVLRKINVNNRTQAALWARAHLRDGEFAHAAGAVADQAPPSPAAALGNGAAARETSRHLPA